MPADVIELITADHRDVEALFAEMKRHPENRPALFAEVCAKFLAHSVAEEERVYPEIAKLVPEERPEVEHGTSEHHKAEEMLFALQDMDCDSPEFERVLDEFIAAVHEHVQEEESQVLPVLAKAAPKRLLQELGRAFSEGKAEVLRNPSAVTPAKLKQNGKHKARSSAKAKGGAQAKGGQATGDMSKGELYEKAKEAHVPGRSHMSKDELAAAVRKSGH